MRGCMIVHACGCATIDGVLARICGQHLATRPDPQAPKHKPVAELDEWAKERALRQARLEADGDRHHYGGDDEGDAR